MKGNREELTDRNRLVEANLPLVSSLAAGYVNNGLLLSDLMQEGSVGLIMAADDFHGPGGEFAAHAAAYIHRAMQAAIEEQAREMGLSVEIIRTVNRAVQASIRLRAERGEDPSLLDIAKLMKVPMKDLQRALLAALRPDLLASRSSGGVAEMPAAGDAAGAHRLSREEESMLRQRFATHVPGEPEAPPLLRGSPRRGKARRPRTSGGSVPGTGRRPPKRASG